MKLASEAPFPYGWCDGSVCYFVEINGGLGQIRGRGTFRGMVRSALAGDLTIYAVWPGQYRSDLFIIDKPELLAAAIGLTVDAS